MAGGDEQEVGQPVDVFQHFRRDALVRLVVEFGDQPLGAPANGAGEMEIGGRRASSRQDERPQRREFVIEPVDLGLEPLDLRRGRL